MEKFFRDTVENFFRDTVEKFFRDTVEKFFRDTVPLVPQQATLCVSVNPVNAYHL